MERRISRRHFVEAGLGAVVSLTAAACTPAVAPGLKEPTAFVKPTPGEATREERMRWWHEARFGMFIHWGLYSQLGRHEWAMNRERIPLAEYERLADSWHPGERPAREWARLAKDSGMRYAVMTTKHYEGFCLWDTQQTMLIGGLRT